MLRLNICFCSLLPGLVCQERHLIQENHHFQDGVMDYVKCFFQFDTVSKLDVEESKMPCSKQLFVNRKQ